MGDRMKITGTYSVMNGDNNFSAKNKFVKKGLHGIMLPFVVYCDSSTTDEYGFGHNMKIKVGDDTSTETVVGMDSLTSLTNGSPDNTSITVHQDGDEYYAVYTSTWESGNITGTLGELGIFLYLPNDEVNADDTSKNPPYDADYRMGSVSMLSRVCEADGDFTSFEIDDTEPLTIEYRLSLTFQG